MADTSSLLALRDFGGVPEIRPSAQELKKQALALSVPITKVETEQEQALAVNALQALKAITRGMESTRKSVKAPVLELGKKIDAVASTFTQEVEREEARISGHINHYQQLQFRLKREEEERLAREQAEAQRLEAEAVRLRAEAEKKNDPALKEQAAALEEKVLDAQMAGELTGGTVAIAKPKGLVVREKVDFRVKDPILFVQAFPEFFKWNAATESLKLDRARILDELNKDRGVFSKTSFPEELSDNKRSPELVKPIGLEVFHSLKSHVR